MSPATIEVINVTAVFLLKAIALFLGYLIIRLGAQLIREGAKGDFKFSGEFSGAKADIASVSPGLLFVLLGALLIGFAVQIHKVEIVDATPPAAAPGVPQK